MVWATIVNFLDEPPSRLHMNQFANPGEGDLGERYWRDCRPTDASSYHLVNSISHEAQCALMVLLGTRF